MGIALCSALLEHVVLSLASRAVKHAMSINCNYM